MKLGRRLLIPIVIISFVAVGLCGLLYYNIMQNRMDTVLRGSLRTTLASLQDEMVVTTNLNDLVTERVDGKNIALARATAELLTQNPEKYNSTEGFARIAAMLHIDEIHITDGEGLIVGGSKPGYYGRSITEMPENQDLLEQMHDPEMAVIQEPRINSAGDWIQYYVVPRTDQPGLIVAGIQYSVATMLQQTFTDGINAEVTAVGETGHIAILHGGEYAAHPNAEMVGRNVSGEEWYRQMAASDEDILWLEIDGESYLVGYSEYGDDILLMALLPESEYNAPMQYMQRITALLILLACLTAVVALYISISRNVIRPLQALSEGVNRVAKGDLSVNIEGRFAGEMEQLRLDVNKTIAQLRSRQDHVLRNFPGVVFCCDTSFLCTVSAGQAMQALGLDPADYLGHNLLEAMRQSTDEQLAALVEKTFAEGEGQRLNLEHKGHYLSITTSLMYGGDGQLTGLVGVCTDVTDLRELQQRLLRATQEAQRASEAKSEFLSRMSHEIRTPMNAIIGMTTIAQKSGEPAKIQYCLDKIQNASDQLLHLINDILDMSKIEANKFELSVSEFDFEGMLQSVSNVIEVRANEKKQDFIIDFTDMFTRNVVSDELRLSQVLLNLLTNAVKFTPEGGRVTLKIRYQAVDESFGRFRFDVIDNGIGISQEQQKRLFTSFEQADGSITRRYGGTGLGLAICKNIVQLMDGDIWVQSTPGEGACFSFTINVKWGNPKGTRDLIHKLPLGDNRILVIDDSEDVCQYFEGILETYQLSCDSALSGPEGIALVEKALQSQTPYSLIFVDFMMPGMDGIETARHIKALAPPETIVIMISVADWSEIEREATSIGVDKFLAKPVLPTVLFQSIVGWLNSAAAEKAAAQAAPGHPEFEGVTMLLAEDIDINREIIIGMLEGTGINVVPAIDGREAVEKYAANPDGYSLILMDIQMPGLDGYEATRMIRGLDAIRGREIPIVAMTANAFKSDVEKCLAAGMNDHIAKPVDMQDLYKKIHVALLHSPKP